MYRTCASLLLCVSALSGVGHAGNTQRLFVVNTVTSEFLHGYLAWAHQHPESFSKSSADGSKTISLPNALVELFSPDGKLLYKGTEDFSNAEFLKRLAFGLPQSLPPVNEGPAPTGPEYVSMFKQLAPVRSSIFAGHSYRLLVVTYPNDKFCAAQNAALQNFKVPSFLKVVEIRLRHGG